MHTNIAVGFPTVKPRTQILFGNSSFAAAKKAWPIFGGDPKPGEGGGSGGGSGSGDSGAGGSGGGSGAGSGSGSGSGAGGSGGGSGNDPIAQLQNNPDALNQLLNQVQTLNTQVQTLQTENQGYKDKETEAARKQQTKEQQLETDKNQLAQQLEKATNIINQKVLENALLNLPDYQWNSIKHVLSEIDPNAIEVSFDLDAGVAEVSGVDKEAKRIAEAHAWMLKSAPGGDANGANGNGRQAPPAPPASGAPPANPSTNNSKANRRAELMRKHPVIAHR